MTKQVYPDPNLSIILPGGCSASCYFCFGQMEGDQPADYMAQVTKVLQDAPAAFWQLSLTGGEPTESPYLEWLLKTIDPKRWGKVVLSTNGYEGRVLGFDLSGVHHINLSRHDIEDNDNRYVYGCEGMPDVDDLKRIIGELHRRAVDVTLNAVLRFVDQDDHQDVVWVADYIQMAREVGASAVTFRKESREGSSLAPPVQIEAYHDHAAVRESSCPVCWSKTIIVDGLPITWKSSLWEPSDDLDDVYELIVQPTGKLTMDWRGSKVVRIKGDYLVDVAEEKRKKLAAQRRRDRVASDDGGGSCGGGC